jgi:hypothetical protein
MHFAKADHAIHLISSLEKGKEDFSLGDLRNFEDWILKK